MGLLVSHTVRVSGPKIARASIRRIRGQHERLAPATLTPWALGSCLLPIAEAALLTRYNDLEWIGQHYAPALAFNP